MRNTTFALVAAVLTAPLAGCTYYDTSLCTSDRLVDLPQLAGHYMIDEGAGEAPEALEIAQVSSGVFKTVGDDSTADTVMRTCDVDGNLSLEVQTGTTFELYGLSVTADETQLTHTDIDPALIESGKVPGECKTEEFTHITTCTVNNSRMRTPGEMTQWIQPSGDAIHMKRDLPPSL